MSMTDVKELKKQLRKAVGSSTGGGTASLLGRALSHIEALEAALDPTLEEAHFNREAGSLEAKFSGGALNVLFAEATKILADAGAENYLSVKGQDRTTGEMYEMVVQRLGDTVTPAEKNELLRDENTKLREITKDLSDELGAEVEHRYQDTKDHPAMKARYDRDMETVLAARRALGMGEEGD